MQELPDVDFSLLAVCEDPFATPRFERPENLTSFRALPLWGIRNSWEIDRRSASEIRRRRRRTTEAAVAQAFLPAYLRFVGQLLGDERDDEGSRRRCTRSTASALEHDFDAAFRSEAVWSAFTALVSRRFPGIARDLGYSAPWLTLGELSAGAQWIYHWLFPLSQPIEEVDIAHATMGGVCSMVGVVCKLEHGAGFLLSEHGIYLRECYLAEAGSDGSLFGKVLKLAFARRITELAYSQADAIAPCCDYNHRWERQIGVEAERIHTAYYGVDPEAFQPSVLAPEDAPVVVWAGRIDPLKDVETLLGAAAVVKDARPDVRFLLYGAAPPGNERYHARCMELYDELGLAEHRELRGLLVEHPRGVRAGEPRRALEHLGGLSVLDARGHALRQGGRRDRRRGRGRADHRRLRSRRAATRSGCARGRDPRRARRHGGVPGALVGGEGAGGEPLRDRAVPRDAPRDLRASCSAAVRVSPSRTRRSRATEVPQERIEMELANA